jgi:uncharacterized tellurite resistance protein B-like protein
MKTLRSWLGLERPAAPEHAPLRELVDALDRLDPDRARHLARFAYLLGRVAHADRHVSPEETHAMETLVMQEGHLSADQAMLVVSLAKTSNLLFGGTADFAVAQEFSDTATYDEKVDLVRCLFAVSATDQTISMAEEAEIHRIANQLRIDPGDLTNLRLAYRQHLPGLSSPRPSGSG